MVGPPTTQSALAATPRSEASTRVAALGTILGVWAHPDDEAYLSAAVMRLALENGQRVACVTATSGERGTADPASWPPEKLGAARRRELQASFAALQSGLGDIIEHEWLGYRDEHCADAAGEAAASELGAVIDRIQPDTVLTFGPGGLTGHPDHQAVAEWVSIALGSRPSIRRLDAVVAASWVEHIQERVEINSYFDDGYPEVVDDAEIDLNLVLDEALWTVKDRALRAHATQTQPVFEHLGPELWRAFSIVESFRTHSISNPTGRERMLRETP